MGVLPDYPLPFTLEEIDFENGDAILNYALKLIEDGKYIKESEEFEIDIVKMICLIAAGFVVVGAASLLFYNYICSMLIFFYILNVTLLLLHEIESGYEKEWEILKLPGKLTGFLLLHVPIIFLFFYGFYCIVEYPQTRGILSILAGITGFIPFLIHKVFVNKKGHFDKTVSNIIIYGNMVSAIVLVITGIVKVFEV